MKNIYAAFLALAAFFSATAQPQQFQLPNMSIRLIDGTDTLDNAWAGGLNSPQISQIDADLDGMKDLFVFDRSNDRVSVFLNNGSTTGNAYHYDYRLSSKFPRINAWALLYDYNGDGLEDFFTMAKCNCGIAVYKNVSSLPNGLAFTLIDTLLYEQYLSSSFNIYATALAVPAFSDIDNDGDMDILGYNSVPDGRIQYHRNYSMENWGIPDSLNFKFESATWGYFKLQVGGTNSVNCYSCRTTGNNGGSPLQFNVTSESDLYSQSHAAQRDDSNTSIYAIDLDGDHDKELLVGDISGSNTLMVCNGGTPASALMDSTCTDTLFPSYDVSIRIRNFASHAYIDVDNDGIRDLLASPERYENKRSIWYYHNTGSDSVPVFDFITNSFICSDMMDVGEGASPVFFDQNQDGYPDLVVGNYGEFNPSNGQLRRRLALYLSTGTPSAPEFTLSTRDFAGIGAMGISGPLYPAFGDLNGDGIDDMILGNGDGTLHYFTGSGNPTAFTLAQANFAGIDVGGSSTPQLVDLNNDSKLDLLIGEQSGFLNYFENIGTFNIPAFNSTPTIDTLGGVNVRLPGFVDGYTVPFAYYENGQYNLWVSSSRGDVYEYQDITSNLYAFWPCTDTLVRGNQGNTQQYYNLAASGTYIDSDNHIDMCLGLYGGGVQFFTSINPSAVPSPQASGSFQLYPNPAKDAVTIKITTPAWKAPYQVELFNSMGQLLQSDKMTLPSKTMDVSALPAGLYLMKVHSNSGEYVQKFFVTR